MKRAAFFDMDRTLVRANTGVLYARWRVARGEARLRDLARVLAWSLQYTFGVVDVDAVGRIAARAVEGRDEARFAEECRVFCTERVLPLVTDTARREVARRRAEGLVPVVLTGSTPYSARPLAASLDIEHVIASPLAVEAGTFTGALEEPLCVGEGKATRAARWAEAHGVSVPESAFYTDSISDLPMLERVREPRVVNPDPRLRRLALRRGWPIEHW